jgi:hypothetical protein
MPWQTPRESEGKASALARNLKPDEVRDIRKTMQLHFRELKAGIGKQGALENPTFGFGCWHADLTRLRERLRGVAPIQSQANVAGATPEARAVIAEMANRYAQRTGG